LRFGGKPVRKPSVDPDRKSAVTNSLSSAMSEPCETALLPAGLRDVLPPDAWFEADVIERLMARFAQHGYERVKPPLIEFEESLLHGPGTAVAGQTFRLMDPVSHRMMGVRADITPQVARLAASRLGKAPRPLRLGYAGQVLRVRGSQLRPERQFAQVGVELIGIPAGPAADAEVVLLAAEALQVVGVEALTVDLCFPPMAAAVTAGLALSAADAGALDAALDHKDAAAVAALGGPAAALLEALLRAAGPVETALARLAEIELTGVAAAARERISALVALVHEAAPGLSLTIDPVERRGFEYQTGVSFTLFAPGVRGELGRGGRYLAGNAASAEAGEAATGFTLYMDSLLRALPLPRSRSRLYLPLGTPAAEAERLRAAGWVTVAGLAPTRDAQAEAKRLGCTHHCLRGEASALA
jgi:ATP phosphoribosyltransferase regulatory subunit